MKIENAFKGKTKLPPTSKGYAGFDNARENIDPKIITKVVIGKEIEILRWRNVYNNSFYIDFNASGLQVHGTTYFYDDVSFNGTLFVNAEAINVPFMVQVNLKASSDGAYLIFAARKNVIVFDAFVQVNDAFDGAVDVICGDTLDNEGFIRSATVDLTTPGWYCLLRSEKGAHLTIGAQTQIRAYDTTDDIYVRFNNPASTVGSVTVYLLVGVVA